MRYLAQGEYFVEMYAYLRETGGKTGTMLNSVSKGSSGRNCKHGNEPSSP